MTLTPDQERWAEALAIEKQHNEGTLSWVANRITELMSAGEVEGMRRFIEIKWRLDLLCRSPRDAALEAS